MMVILLIFILLINVVDGQIEFFLNNGAACLGYFGVIVLSSNEAH